MANPSQGRGLKRCETRGDRERDVLSLYIGIYYINLNLLLSNRDTIDSYHNSPFPLTYYMYGRYFYHYIMGSYNGARNKARAESIVESHWNDLQWFQQLYYQFMMELYGMIKRCPLQVTPPTVYRGVKQHYLKEDPSSNGYLITTFLSTSATRSVPFKFSQRYLYIFIVAPDTQGMYIGGYEDEFIINPYVFYTFIKKEEKVSHTEYYYLLSSSGFVTPPDNFESFMEFRDSIAPFSNAVRGGSDIVSNNQLRRMGNTNRGATMNKRNMKGNMKRNTNKRNMNGTMKRNMKGNTKRANTSSKLAANLVRERMTSFIGTSSKAVPLTREMKEMVQEVREQLDREGEGEGERE